ncbi:MAG TPA: hypothetical protein VJY84_01805 [Candidatus Saccharimonadales bacterium]|nr:hypothetical protein [Candidatus Saccharimonadales bacterium]
MEIRLETPGHDHSEDVEYARDLWERCDRGEVHPDDLSLSDLMVLTHHYPETFRKMVG